jgi:hypothetical protein
MPSSERPKVLLSAALLGALAVALPAEAFRPTTRWILDQAAGKQEARAVKSLKVEQEATLFGVPTAPRGLGASQRTWLLSPFQLRVELELPEGTDVRVQTPQRAQHTRPGQRPEAQRGAPDLLAAFVGGGPPAERRQVGEQMLKDLQRLQVDPSVVSYARFDGRVAYLIGSKPWEKDKPQVWLDKESLHLLRVVEVEKRGEALFVRDTHYTGYGSAEAGAWFPKVIEVYEGGALKLRAVTRAVEKNEAIDRGLFELR